MHGKEQGVSCNCGVRSSDNGTVGLSARFFVWVLMNSGESVQAGQLRNHGSVPGRESQSFPLQKKGPGPESYSVGTVYFSGGKAAGT